MLQENENCGSAQSGAGKDASSWYRQEAASAQPHALRPKRKGHTGLIITLVIVGVLVLIAATALIFSAVSFDEVVPDNFGNYDGIDPEDPFYFGDGDFRDFFDSYYTYPDTIEESSIERAETGTGATIELVSSAEGEELSLNEIYTACVSTVVGVTAYPEEGGGMYWGTGVVMTEDGYIITNAHVIAGTYKATVVLDNGEEYDAQLVGEDTQTDIAVLKINATGLTAASFGRSDELRVGDEVVAIGNPLGYELTGTMNNGIISAISRNMQVEGNYMTLLQTNAAINEGNSGGPLINMYGQVIGITNMKMSSVYSETTIEGLGFAIPSQTVKTVADQLVENGRVLGRPSIGITVGSIPVEAQSQFTLPDGLYISLVTEGSDAEAKGVVEGDILTAVNQIPVTTSNEVLAIKNQFAVGDTLTLTIFRDGKSFDVEVELYDAAGNG